jgi:predicted nucleotide-binding protein
MTDIAFEGNHMNVTKEPDVTRSNVFIGHGRSPVWLELKIFLTERLGLSCEEFNSTSAAGIPTAERLTQMLEVAAFAFLVMTPEDETPDGRKQARMNVVHEAGLFQGRLGFKKAIILLDEGCEEFSNIVGLGQIRFPRGNIAAATEEIRRVLEREGII